MEPNPEGVHPFLNPLRLQTEAEFKKLREEIAQAQQHLSQASTALEMRQNELTAKLDSFYTKLIEIFGLFVAVFSFIIAGIQVATKQAGSFYEQLAISGAVFFPLTLCIVVLLLMVRWVVRK